MEKQTKTQIDREHLREFVAKLKSWALFFGQRMDFVRQYAEKFADLPADGDPLDADPVECYHETGQDFAGFLSELREEMAEMIEDILEASACVVRDCDDYDGEE